MTYPQAFVIALIQGVTEPFPVSSLGHSVLIPAWFGGSWQTLVTQSSQASSESSFYLAYIVALHCAPALALMWFFRADWIRIIRGFFRSLPASVRLTAAARSVPSMCQRAARPVSPAPWRAVIVGIVSDLQPLGLRGPASDSDVAGVVVTAANESLADHGMSEPVDVLLVEDDPGDVLMTREAFEQHKIRNRLHVVSDGEQAIEFLRRAGDFASARRPGLILLDLNLPRRSGLEVLAEVKSDSELRSIPVVVLSTSDARGDILGSYSLHANAYITKPMDFDRFMNAIRQIDDFYLTLVKLPA